jgi:hypothetical protein
MREALSQVLGGDDDASVDRIMTNAFFRKRPFQSGVSAVVITLADRADFFERTVRDERSEELPEHGGVRA